MQSQTKLSSKQPKQQYVCRLLQKLSNRIHQTEDAQSVLFSQRNQIWHLFCLVTSDRRDVICSYGKKTYQGKIVELSRELAVLYISNFVNEKIASLRIEFIHADTSYWVEASIVSTYKQYLFLQIPYLFHSQKKRKKTRISSNDVLLNFTLCYPPYPLTPIQNLYTNDFQNIYSLRFIINEVEKEYPNINLLYKMFTDHLYKMGLEWSFHVCSSKEDPEDISNIIDKIIREENAVFFIKNTQDIDTYHSKPTSQYLTNFHSYYEKLQSSSQAENDALFMKVQKEDTDNSLKSYAYAPLKALGKTIGHIHLTSSLFSKRVITEEDAIYLDMLSKFFTYAINKASITKKHYHPIGIPVLDISQTGLSFTIEKELGECLIQEGYMQLKIILPENVINTKAKITRNELLKEKNKMKIGLEFYKSEPNTNLILENYIYKRLSKNLKADFE